MKRIFVVALAFLINAAACFAEQANGTLTSTMYLNKFNIKSYTWQTETLYLSYGDLQVYDVEGEMFLNEFTAGKGKLSTVNFKVEKNAQIKTKLIYQISKSKNFKNSKWFVRFECSGKDLVLPWENPRFTDQITSFNIIQNQDKTYTARVYPSNVNFVICEDADAFDLPGSSVKSASLKMNTEVFISELTDQMEASTTDSALWHWAKVSDAEGNGGWILSNYLATKDQNRGGYNMNDSVFFEIELLFNNPL